MLNKFAIIGSNVFYLVLPWNIPFYKFTPFLFSDAVTASLSDEAEGGVGMLINAYYIMEIIEMWLLSILNNIIQQRKKLI